MFLWNSLAFLMILVSRECMFLGSLSRHNKDLEQRTLSPWSITALGSWTNCVTALKQISVTAPFYLEDSRRVRESEREWERVREWERERESARARESERKRARTHVRAQEIESQRKRFGSSFYMFFLPPGPALCKLGLARSAVCSVCSAWSLHSGPQTFLVF